MSEWRNGKKPDTWAEVLTSWAWRPLEDTPVQTGLVQSRPRLCRQGSCKARQQCHQDGFTPAAQAGMHHLWLWVTGLPSCLLEITHFPTTPSKIEDSAMLSAITMRMEHYRLTSSRASLHVGTGWGPGIAQLSVDHKQRTLEHSKDLRATRTWGLKRCGFPIYEIVSILYCLRKKYNCDMLRSLCSSFHILLTAIAYFQQF